jgi:RNA polymerase sigma-32 factor
MRCWSLVKVGTTQAQKKLFFTLRSAKAKLPMPESSEEKLKKLSKMLEIKEKDILEMELRLSARDFSLDFIRDDDEVPYLDRIKYAEPEQEKALILKEERKLLQGKIKEALSRLSERERYIVKKRLMVDKPQTLVKIGEKFGISRERARQIENRAKEKIKKFINEELDLN